MEQKRSGVGIAAGILYSFLLLYSMAVDIISIIRFPAGYLDLHYLSWWLGKLAVRCESVFLIISLFGERRSRLLLTSYIINAVLFSGQIVDILRNNQSLFSVTALMMTASTILITVMAVYCCIPSLQKDAGWTGKIWFLPPVLHGIVSVISILHYPAMYWENFQYHPLWLTFQLSLTVLNIVAEFLFCLWLTEPYRKKKSIA